MKWEWTMCLGSRAIAIVNAVLVIAAASSSSLLAQPRTPTAAGLWEKLDSSGQPEAKFRIMDCNGLYQGKIVEIFPRPGEDDPSTFRCTECEGEQKDAPVMSDGAYDELRLELEAIVDRFPELETDDSPTRRVGAAPSGGFRKVRHAASAEIM